MSEIKVKKEQGGFFDGMSKIARGLFSIFNKNDGGLDVATMNDLEHLLLEADLGFQATEQILQNIKSSNLGKDATVDAVKLVIARSIADILAQNACTGSILADLNSAPYVIMFCGINGSGKTSTVAKVANIFKNNGLNIGLGACDTFRAAAVEQLSKWGNEMQLPVFSGSENADPASVAYAACAKAVELKLDCLLIDTAGRMHNQANLMDELKKIERTIAKVIPGAPNKTILVIDGNAGQNAHKQVEAYVKNMKVDGLIMTKLDGSARGGVILGLSSVYKLPIYYVCVGERIADIREFDPNKFVDLLLDI